VVAADGFGAMVEWYRQGKTELQVGKQYIVWVLGEDVYGAMVEWY